MKSNIVRMKSFIACLCTVIMSVFAVTGCSEMANDQNETPAGDSSIESTGEYSSEHSEVPVESSSTESTDGYSTSSDNEYQPYEEKYVDQQYLGTLEQDILDVDVNLCIDEEALRAEYEEKYPDLADNYDYWGRFLIDRGEQIIREFVSDYNINYEELKSVLRMGGTFRYELDKDTISSMLNDSRVATILYYPGGRPIFTDWTNEQ